MKELVFEVTQDTDGGFSAEYLTEAIFIQADNRADLRRMVRDAVDGYFFDRSKPEAVRLHLIHDEVLVCA